MASRTERKGLLYVLVGPSGVGKNTLMQEALKQVANLRQLPTATTRKKRPGEQEGREHFFVSREEFQRLIEDNALLEWQNVHGELYGVVRRVIEEGLESETDLIADIEVLGASVLRQQYPDNAVLIFITPSDKTTLEERIRHRGDADEAEISRRLQRADFEIRFAPQCRYLIINDDLEQATRTLVSIIRAERSHRDLRSLSVSALVHHEGNVLVWMQATSQPPELPTTAVRPGEAPQQAVTRLLDEIGLGRVSFQSATGAPTEDIIPVHFRLIETGGRPSLNLIFSCTPVAPSTTPAHAGWRWMALEAVPLAQTILRGWSQAVSPSQG